MFLENLHVLLLGTQLGVWEIVLIVAVVLIVLGASRLPELMRGLRTGTSEFLKASDRLAREAGKSAGGVFGKPAAEALTPDNKTAELYDPAVFHKNRRRRSVRRVFRNVWGKLLRWLGIKH